MALPHAALVGRPNVGKSSLFNRLTQSKDALTAREAGVTRDLLFGIVDSAEPPFILIDSPGHFNDKQELTHLMSGQAEKARQSADLILLVCEPQLHGEDQRILAGLRRTGKPVWVIVNKLDHLADEAALAEFHQLGLEVFGVSAHSGLGTKQLITSINKLFSHHPIDAPPTSKDLPRITLLGRPNTGKSTLANCLLGGEHQLVSEQAGTTRDSVLRDFSWQHKDYQLVDTAGIRRKSRIADNLEKMTVAQAISAAYASHVVVLLLDAGEDITHQDLALLQLIEKLGKGLVIGINKSDLLSDKNQLRISLDSRLRFVNYADYHFISAKHCRGLKPLMQSVDQAYMAAGQQWKNRQLNDLLAHCLVRQQPAMVQGQQSRPRYAHQIKSYPPRIAIHGKRLHKLSASYKRYLKHCLSKGLKLRGVPLQLEFRTDSNPYASADR